MLAVVPAGAAALTWGPVAAATLLALAVLAFLGRRLRARRKASRRADGRAAPVETGWDEIAGLDDAADELRALADLLREPGRCARLGAHPPRGILLYGPPGGGKSLLASATVAAAGTPAFVLEPSADASGVRTIFAAARAAAPAIVLVEHLDARSTAAAAAPAGPAAAALDRLITELDAPGPAVVVLGTAVRFDAVAPPLLRAGRFDRHLLCAPPDLAGREAILRIHAADMPLAADADLGSIARQSAGLSGADLAAVTNEAALLAGRQELLHVRHVDFEAALERVVVGLPQRRRVSEREKRILAYHEAGHVLVADALGVGPIQKVTIIGRGEALGATIGLPGDDRQLRSRDELIDVLTITLAGRAAEHVAFGRVTDGAADDLERATQLARAMVFDYGMGDDAPSRTMRADNYALSEESKRQRDAAQSRLSDGAYELALTLLVEHRTALDRLAVELLRKETLDRQELQELLDVQAHEAAERTFALGVVRALPRRD